MVGSAMAVVEAGEGGGIGGCWAWLERVGEDRRDLLDSGSTHNFISEEAARRTGLPLQQRPRLTAMVANGEKITCASVIRKAPLIIAGAACSIH
jgi:predicted aspartyl protease